MTEQTRHHNRRFTVEEIDNGFLLKVNELGTDKLLGRHAYLDAESLMKAIEEFLMEEPS